MINVAVMGLYMDTIAEVFTGKHGRNRNKPRFRNSSQE